MKYLKLYENFSNKELEEMCKELLVGKKIIATDDKLVDSLPFRIKSDKLVFTPTSVEIKDTVDGKSLRVIVPTSNIKGKISNPLNYRYTDSGALCMVMTAWIHWNITKNLPEHVDVMVFNN